MSLRDRWTKLTHTVRWIWFMLFLTTIALIVVLGLHIVFFANTHKDTSDWMINCAPTDAIPLISDAQDAVTELATMPTEHCRALDRSTIILCHGTACISRFEPIEERRLKEINGYKEYPESEPTCMFWANWLNRIIEKSECRSPDGLRAEGRIIRDNEGQDLSDVRLLSNTTLGWTFGR
ncbi:uncharacterized protein H6S33_010566 [Morchella sextelata]|uniref:uncharacterized protein n=1 Tax=Morchella sextelata TaxID=1174677 RepID=UPI001D058DB5|nr:uncharacterized protein H6S33_010566 [Morchella sextelata]KAH0611301.1 hypothetical protein H6S33_010566 [Morchella sextelata]